MARKRAARPAAGRCTSSTCCQTVCLLPTLGAVTLLLLGIGHRDYGVNSGLDETPKKSLNAAARDSAAVAESGRDNSAASKAGMPEGSMRETRHQPSSTDMPSTPESTVLEDVRESIGSRAQGQGDSAASTDARPAQESDDIDVSASGAEFQNRTGKPNGTSAERKCGVSPVTGQPVECLGTSDNPCCRIDSGVCGHTKNECSCGQQCLDNSATGGWKQTHEVGRGCNMTAPILSQDWPTMRVAVLSVGQKRIFMRPVSELQLDGSIKARLKQRGISKVFDSHRIHVLDPLHKQTGIRPDYFLCVENLGTGTLPREVTEAWAFERKSQLGRVKACLKRVLEREAACSKVGFSGPQYYGIFVRLRPDFLVFSDIPRPQLAVSRGCVMTRFRLAVNIWGLTNEHISMCFCRDNCCGGAGAAKTAGYVVDDMVAVVPRQFAEALWTGIEGPKPIPGQWPMMPEFFESSLTRFWLTQGIPVCPLAFRGLPMGSPLVKTHVQAATGCGYATGEQARPQLRCGRVVHANNVSGLTPGPFIPANQTGVGQAFASKPSKASKRKGQSPRSSKSGKK